MINVTISKTLDDVWVTDEQASGMSDSDIIRNYILDSR